MFITNDYLQCKFYTLLCCFEIFFKDINGVFFRFSTWEVVERRCKVDFASFQPSFSFAWVPLHRIESRDRSCSTHLQRNPLKNAKIQLLIGPNYDLDQNISKYHFVMWIWVLFYLGRDFCCMLCSRLEEGIPFLHLLFVWSRSDFLFLFRFHKLQSIHSIVSKHQLDSQLEASLMD